MKKCSKKKLETKGYPNYSRVAIQGLKKSRKGKHHDLMTKIMEDLRGSVPGFAVCIPLPSTDQIPILNLRSAVVRIAAKEGIAVSTSSDDQNFYVWKTANRA